MADGQVHEQPRLSLPLPRTQGFMTSWLFSASFLQVDNLSSLAPHPHHHLPITVAIHLFCGLFCCSVPLRITWTFIKPS